MGEFVHCRRALWTSYHKSAAISITVYVDGIEFLTPTGSRKKLQGKISML